MTDDERKRAETEGMPYLPMPITSEDLAFAAARQTTEAELLQMLLARFAIPKNVIVHDATA